MEGRSREPGSGGEEGMDRAVKGKGGYVGVGSGMRKAATMRPKVATPTQVTGEGYKGKSAMGSSWV